MERADRLRLLKQNLEKIVSLKPLDKAKEYFGKCQYLYPDGSRCAVGAMLTDFEIDAIMSAGRNCSTVGAINFLDDNDLLPVMRLIQDLSDKVMGNKCFHANQAKLRKVISDILEEVA